MSSPLRPPYRWILRIILQPRATLSKQERRKQFSIPVWLGATNSPWLSGEERHFFGQASKFEGGCVSIFCTASSLRFGVFWVHHLFHANMKSSGSDLVWPGLTDTNRLMPAGEPCWPESPCANIEIGRIRPSALPRYEQHGRGAVSGCVESTASKKVSVHDSDDSQTSWVDSFRGCSHRGLCSP